MTPRAPAVAGLFYPADPARLDASVRGFLGAATARPASTRPPKAVIVPHAGYAYSAAIAASAYREIGAHRARYTRVVLLGPAHRVALDGIAIPSCDRFGFPGGEIVLDTTALDELAAVPGVQVSDVAHAAEHSLEVQLPFLAAVLGNFMLVPFVVGPCAPAIVADALRAVWGGPETLIVVSSDLSHYLPYTEATAIDRETAAAIVQRSTRLHGREACGAHAINGLMTVARERGLDVEMLDVRNSGDTAGDRTRVVGYGAFSLH
tara:strand:- start:1013 stop:1801 length:789 start_codon:yes stop_codon:yes gene_type:complete